MGDSFYKKQLNILKSLSPDILDHITRGIEKENIRTDASGNPAITAHPKQLGAALTHPSITTDFHFISASNGLPLEFKFSTSGRSTGKSSLGILITLSSSS